MDRVYGPVDRVHGVLAHRCTDHIKPLLRNPPPIKVSLIKRKGISVSNLGRTGKIGRRGGWLRLGVAQARAHGSAPWPSVAAHRSLGFLEP
jgi:hypothetical protein